jgi:elongation factor G
MFDLHRVNTVESDEIPASALEVATRKRTELIEQLAEIDDETTDLILNDSLPSTEQLVVVIWRATLSFEFSPVFFGSVVKNTAVQPLFDGVCAYLRAPQSVRSCTIPRS